MQAVKPSVRIGNYIRKGRGYSLGELKEVGLNPRIARKSGLPVDVWRQTKHPGNVEQLKSIIKTNEPRESAKKNKKKKE
jgi:ribosomal protein L13E